MFDIRKYAFVTAAIIALVLVACAPNSKEDCEAEHANDQERGDYEECLQNLAFRHENQTAEAVANKAATATEEAVIAAERVEYAATVAALDESLKSTGDSQTLSRAGTITGSAAKETPTAEPVPSPVVDTAPVVDSEQPVPTAVPTAVPAATAIPEPTPTPTEIPVDLSTLAWLTAHQAAELALLEADGEVFEIAGHASRAAGVLSSGDSTGAELSPGIGYARDWSVTLQNDVEAIFCTIGLGLTSCNNGGFHYGDGEVGTVTVDSPAALARFNSESNSDWQALTANEDISILLDLHPDLSGAINAEPGTPIARIWSASITVHNATDGLRSGSFHWNLDTDDITWSVF